MTVRTSVYGRLTSFDDLVLLIGGTSPRVFAKKSMTSSIEETPYIVYKLGYNASEEIAETEDISRQFLQIFVHDYSDGDVADYIRIDEVINKIKAAFYLWSDPPYIISAKYLETSQDLNDETLNTVMKYVRIQLITKEQ